MLVSTDTRDARKEMSVNEELIVPAKSSLDKILPLFSPPFPRVLCTVKELVPSEN